MSSISAIPWQVVCSNCQSVLLEAHLDVETAEAIKLVWIVVDQINLVCGECGAALTAADDDFDRVITELKEFGTNSDEGLGP